MKEYSSRMKLNIFRSIILIICLILLSGCSPYTKGEPIESNLPDKYSFLILDIQNDFMAKDGKLPISPIQSRDIINKINMLLSILTQSEVEVVYIGNEFKKSDTIANWFRNNAAIKGTDGAKLDSNLNIINNNYFSKSSPDAFSNKSFDQYLREQKISKLIIAGVFADQCVLSTVKGGLNRKYEVYVISDAIGAKNDSDIEKAIKAYKKLNAHTVTSEQIINKIKL